jgi:thiamine pyrophosphokinase
MGRLIGHGRSLASGPGAGIEPVAGGRIAIVNALILADGDAPSRSDLDVVWPGWDTDIGLVVAADGGARHAGRLGVVIDAWVGDGDSLDAAGLAALEASGVPIERSSPEKDESDTELAVRAALRRGAAGLSILGALGGARIDHTLANIGLLAMAELIGHRVVLLDAGSRISLIRAPGPAGTAVRHDISGRIGDLVSLLPMSPDVIGVTTVGLAYPLLDEPLPQGPARGLSNVRAANDAGVFVRKGHLLVVESPATLGS